MIQHHAIFFKAISYENVICYFCGYIVRCKRDSFFIDLKRGRIYENHNLR